MYVCMYVCIYIYIIRIIFIHIQYNIHCLYTYGALWGNLILVAYHHRIINHLLIVILDPSEVPTGPVAGTSASNSEVLGCHLYNELLTNQNGDFFQRKHVEFKHQLVHFQQKWRGHLIDVFSPDRSSDCFRTSTIWRKSLRKSGEIVEYIFQIF